MLALSTGPADVGTEQDARRARVGALDALDSGLYKTVYVDEYRTTVYKVAKVHGTDCGYSNSPQMAAEAMMSARGIEAGTPGVPPVSVYMIDGRPVLAMPYFDGKAPADLVRNEYGRPEIVTEYLQGWSRLGIVDMHDGNYTWTREGTPVIIDLAGYGLPYGTEPSGAFSTVADAETTDNESDDSCEACGYGDADDYPEHDICNDCGVCRDCDDCQCEDTAETTAEPSAVAVAGGDLCGLATRMIANGQCVGGFPVRPKGPTCGHPSRHPSRIVRMVEPSPAGQVHLWYLDLDPANSRYQRAIWPDLTGAPMA